MVAMNNNATFLNTARLNRKGLSLVELMVALSVLLLVLAIGYPFYFFGTRSFAVGEEQSNVQRDLRVAASFITRELRNATFVQIGTDTADDGYEYIYLNDDNIKHLKDTTITTWTNDNILSLSFNIEEKENIVTFQITGQEGNQVYSINSSVHLNNVKNQPEASGSLIRYSNDL
ncbi:prepilin-type N-terminal cleavage/methylation domain-containing protein [Dethiobacter alkaliphilus]|uniref:prepilin-type N-terminal cleavage/methylation domain-containing protein n=1 Tax=Dethiobacter alkaliphilus TaxID=427926 RepID=UPI002227C2E9|nr:prepilin-type N-terminal cleavage/methylation domain-containing protein [Dethiobacter alkaliphilus]MCW3490306.1 prepilin-type N-terminal cleavage/methylation domain-containing protein [Dethiobacter alkaliphilus]